MKSSPTLYMAPIRGITQFIYRNLYFKFFGGFDLAVAPFIPTIQSRKCKNSHIKDVLPENNKGFPVVPQLMSNNSDDFIFLCRKLHDHGYDIFNWNLGCPFPMVAKKKRGAGLLPYPDRIDAFLEHVVSEIPGKISIKCRLGREKEDEIFPLIEVFNRYPLKEVILHPRTGIQMYDGNVCLNYFEECIHQIQHPVVYNGDIQTLEDFQKLQERFTTITTWMIGRGALVNPFLPDILKHGRDTQTEKLQKIRKFHDKLYEYYKDWMNGPAHLIDKMKGFWFYFSQAFENQETIFKRIKKMKQVERYESTIADFFENEAVLRI